jgi:acyl-CoA reductase-like NAD-dependent aldehyde dehydrogenase
MVLVLACIPVGNLICINWFIMPKSYLADANQCMRVSSALEAGTVSVTRAFLTVLLTIPKVWINQYNLLDNNVPFGGKKQSGIGWFSMPLRHF